MQTAIIALSNNKGGVAKTTTCLSLGACLAELEQTTLVVDLDPQADLTLSAGLDAETLPSSLVDLLNPSAEPVSFESVVQPTSIPNLDILPADPRLAGVERHLYEQADYETALLRLLKPHYDHYNYILLDCPPSLGGLTLMALTTARWVIIPVQCEYLAARRLSRLVNVIEVIRTRTNPDLGYFLLPTLFDRRNRISRGVLEQLQAHFEANLLETVIGVDTRLRESPATGEPIIAYAPRTRASKQYRALAQEIHTKLT